jgi:hypothetical protein
MQPPLILRNFLGVHQVMPVIPQKSGANGDVFWAEDSGLTKEVRNENDYSYLLL